MSSKHVIKFYLIAVFFKNNEKQLQRGENAYTSGHVRKMEFFPEMEPPILRGDVQASMKHRTYHVEISIDLKAGIKASSCTCPRGQVICHHMAALLYYGHYNISSTDKEQAWGAPSKKGTEDETLTIEEIFSPQVSFQAVQQEIDQESIDKFCQQLGTTNVVGFSWLLKPEVAQEIHLLVPCIEDILFSQEYFNNQDKTEFLISKSTISWDRIVQIAEETKGQHSNESWLVTRKHRLTSSKFGLILKACRRGRFPPSLYKSLIEGYDLHSVLAVQWGTNNEPNAVKKFEEVTGLVVIPTGLWLDESGLLGASPDGLIGSDAILEIKCPYKFRAASLKEGVKDRKYFYYYEDNEVKVDTDHNYYHQVQGQLFFTKRQKCYFFVWTPREYEVFIIEKDATWESNIQIVKNFYLNNFVKAIFDLK